MRGLGVQGAPGVIGIALGWPVLLLGAALAFVLSAVVSLVLRRVTLKSALLGAFTAVLVT